MPRLSPSTSTGLASNIPETTDSIDTGLAQSSGRAARATATGLTLNSPRVTPELLAWPMLPRAQMSEGINVSTGIKKILVDYFRHLKDGPWRHQPPPNVIRRGGASSLVFTLPEAPDLIFKSMEPGVSFVGAMSRAERFMASRHVASACQQLELSGLVVPRAKLIDFEVDGSSYAVIAEEKIEHCSNALLQEELFWQGGESLDELVLQLTEAIAATGLTDIAGRNVALIPPAVEPRGPDKLQGSRLLLMDLEEFSSDGDGLLGRHRPPGLLNLVRPELGQRIILRAREAGLHLPDSKVAAWTARQRALVERRHDLENWHRARGLDSQWGRPIRLPPNSSYFSWPARYFYLSPGHRSLARELITRINNIVDDQKDFAINTFSARRVQFPHDPEFKNNASLDDVVQVLEALRKENLLFYFDVSGYWVTVWA